MVSVLVLAATTQFFTPPQLIAFNFAAPPRIPLVADADGDGLADLLCVYPPGGGIIDVSRNVDGQKPAFGVQARTNFGPDCLAATAGEFLGTQGGDVAAVFADGSVRVAHTMEGAKYQVVTEVHRFDPPLLEPVMGISRKGFTVISSKSGAGLRFIFDNEPQKVDIALPAGVRWFEFDGKRWIVQMAGGELRSYGPRLLDHRILRNGDPGEPVCLWEGRVIAGGHLLEGAEAIPLKGLADEEEPYVLRTGDMDGDGRSDLVKIRYGSRKHESWDIEVLFSLSPGDDDWDRDGLTNAEEQLLGTDPWDRDTDNDGLLDGWEIRGYRGLDLKALGCSPLQPDVICYIQRNENVDEERAKKELERVRQFYRDLPVENLNLTQGVFLHLIYLEPTSLESVKGKGWPQVGRETMPQEHRGIAHWMHITKGGGGQANQMGDMGAVGDASMFAVFAHEFGHQLGLDHTGHWGPSHCPTYTSLMSYAYSYSFDDKGSAIHYSRGALASYVIRETQLDEVLPFPYEVVKFLEKGPYRFRLQPNGDTTLIDWNWNGVFGERNIRADINYGYSTHAGTRQTVAKAHSSPWLFVHAGRAVNLFAQLPTEPKPGEPATVSEENPGSLVAMFHTAGTSWDGPHTIWGKEVIGDPCGMSLGESYMVLAPTSKGIKWQELFGTEPGNSGILPDSTGRRVTCGVVKDKAIVVLHKDNGELEYSVFLGGQEWSEARSLPFNSKTAPGFCVDTKTNQVIFATTQDQSEAKTSRWQVRWCDFDGEVFRENRFEWVEGEEGNARGSGRLLPLFDDSEDAGAGGRVYVFGPGLRTNKDAPWTQQYVAHQIADKTVRGGWLVKRYYDEWTNSRSDSAACWYDNDVLWSYRWVDGAQGATDNNLQVGYRGLGIEEAPMGDHDDVGFILKYGLRRSIMWLNVAKR